LAAKPIRSAGIRLAAPQAVHCTMKALVGFI
jgi:hypothetical protein